MRGLRAAFIIGLWAAAMPSLSRAADPLEAFKNDPSPKAGERLAGLYEKTTSPDQRFWIIHALSVRLKEFGDESALETLLEASANSDPSLQGTAFRGLMGFESVPTERLDGVWLARIDQAVSRGIGSEIPGVRESAAELQKALQRWRDPDSQKESAKPEPYVYSSRGGWSVVSAVLRWLWLALVPVCALIWLAMGFPVFDASTDEGRAAQAVWKAVRTQKIFLTATFVFWFLFAALLAGFGFDLLVLFLGRPLYPSQGDWFRAYLAGGFCMFAPGALIAAAIARRPGGSAAMGALRYFPHALLMTGLVFLFLLPLEIFYRFFFRHSKPRGESRPLDLFEGLVWTWETGSLRGAMFASAIMARERRGLVPALARSLSLFPRGGSHVTVGLASFDVRFGILGAAPLLAALCALIARGLPVQWGVPWPVVMMGCAFWAWGVLAGVLLAMVLMLEGVALAVRYLKSVDVELGPEYGPIIGLEEPNKE